MSRNALDYLGDFGYGAGQGALANWTDEAGLLQEDGQGRNKLALALGEGVGAIPLAALGAGIAKQAGQSGGARARILTALLAGGLHGALAGSGKGEGDDRVTNALLGAAIGAGIGGGALPASRALRDLARNAPAMMGRVAQAEGKATWARPGKGTRTDAALRIKLAAEGPDRVQNALRAAMMQDEGDLLRQTGKRSMGRYGKTVTPFDEPNAGRSLRALTDYASASPGGASLLNQQADSMLEKAVKQQAKALRKTTTARSAPLKTDDAKDFLSAFDDPRAHQAWLEQVSSLKPGQRGSLASKIIAKVKADAEAQGASFEAKLRDPQTAEKLQAIGIKIRAGRGGPPLDNPDLQAKVAGLRERTKRDRFEFANIDDRLLAQRGQLDPEDAAAMIRAAQQPQRSFLVDPDLEARILRGEYERGMQFAPQDYFKTADMNDLMGSIKVSQPIAAGSLAFLASGEEEPPPRRKRELLIAENR